MELLPVPGHLAGPAADSAAGNRRPCLPLSIRQWLTFHGDGPSEECLAMIQLGSQQAHLRQKGISFCGLKLKLEIQPPNVFIVPPCVYTFLCYRERIVRC
jgi:hypothetical protein